MSTDRPKCPKCGSEHTVKNGKIGKRKFKCQSCERQFIENPTQSNDAQTKELIDQLLLESLFSWYS